MSDIVHDTFAIVRVYPVPPRRLFEAFSDATRKRRWYAQGGHTILESYTLDFREGGVERAVSRFGPGSPFPGVALIAEAVHQDIRPGERIVQSQTMTLGDRRISAALITFQFEPAADAAKLALTHQAAFFEGSGGPDMRRDGWASLLDRLAEALADPAS
jgi:uncharacterized protein YndB with AHSA1/START domain